MADVINPRNFDNVISINTISGNIMYALTNDNNITYGDVVTNILHQVKYKVLIGDYYQKTENLFLRDLETNKIHFDLTRKVNLKNNKAHLAIHFEPNVFNYSPLSWKEKYRQMEEDLRIRNQNLEKYKKLSSGIESSLSIKTLTGKIVPIKIPLNCQVKDLKYMIQLAEGVPIDQQRLIYNGKQFSNEPTLMEYGITGGETIHLVLGLRGGMFHETSGRAGCYSSIKNLIFSLDDNRDDMSKHYIPDKPKYVDGKDDYYTGREVSEYYGLGQEIESDK